MTQRQEALRLRLVAGQLAEQIGERIRRRRMELGLNQRQLAERIPKPTISGQTVSDWERGVYQPSPGSLELLATALEVEHAYFYLREQEKQNGSANLIDVFASNPSDIEGLLREILSRLDELERPGGRLDQLEDKIDLSRAERARDAAALLQQSREALGAIERRLPPAQQ